MDHDKREKAWKRMGYGLDPIKDPKPAPPRASPAERPCKHHLTLLDVNAKCPACGWPAGDHPAHPSNKQPRLYNEASELRRKLSELQAEHQMLCDMTASLMDERGIVDHRSSKPKLDALQGTLELRIEGQKVILERLK